MDPSTFVTHPQTPRIPLAAWDGRPTDASRTGRVSALAGALARTFGALARLMRDRPLRLLCLCTGHGALDLGRTLASRRALKRLGIACVRSPQRANVLLVAGPLPIKALKRIVLAYEAMACPKYVLGLGAGTVNGGTYWQSYATAKQLDDYLPVDLSLAGAMPVPEAAAAGLRELVECIRNGTAAAWQDYYRDYDRYLGNQQRLFGAHWRPAGDLLAEARRLGLAGPGTQGEHTARLAAPPPPAPGARRLDLADLSPDRSGRRERP